MASESRPSNGPGQASPPATAGRQDDFFDVLSRVLKAMEGAVEAFHIIGDEDKDKVLQDKDTWGKRPQLSSVSKKRMVKRTLNNLLQGVEELTVLRQAGKDLQGHFLSSQRLQSEAERSRQEVYLQLQSISGAMQDTSMKLNRSEEARLVAIQGLEEEKERTSSLEMRVKDLEEQLAASDLEVKDREAQLQSTKESVQKSLEEAEEAIHGGAEARQREAEARWEADQMRLSMEKAQEACWRHQEAVAKLTADNLMFMMRMKKAEDEAEQLRAQRDELRQGLEHQEGPWFDTVRAGVEQQVSRAMQRANELEALLEAEQAASAEAGKQATAQWEALHERLRGIEAARDGLQTTLARNEEEAARLRDALEAASQETREERRRAETAEAEVRVLNDSVRDMRHECQEAAMRVKQVDDLESNLKNSLAEEQRKSKVLEDSLRQYKAALEVQTRMNRDLMDRKQEVEWKLMTAMAQVQVGAGASLHVVEDQAFQHQAEPKEYEVPPAGQEDPVLANGCQRCEQEEVGSSSLIEKSPTNAGGPEALRSDDSEIINKTNLTSDDEVRDSAIAPSESPATMQTKVLNPTSGRTLTKLEAGSKENFESFATGFQSSDLSPTLLPVTGISMVSSRLPAALIQTTAPEDADGNSEQAKQDSI